MSFFSAKHGSKLLKSRYLQVIASHLKRSYLKKHICIYTENTYVDVYMCIHI